MNSPLVYSIPEACAVACAGRTAVYEAIRTGALRAVKRGRRTLIIHGDLLQWVQSLPPVKEEEDRSHTCLTHGARVPDTTKRASSGDSSC